MNSTLTKQDAAARIQIWWRERNGRHLWVREREGGLWEHLTGLGADCETDLEYPTMRPDSVPISERDSDLYLTDPYIIQPTPLLLPPIPDYKPVWRRMRS